MILDLLKKNSKKAFLLALGAGVMIVCGLLLRQLVWERIAAFPLLSTQPEDGAVAVDPNPGVILEFSKPLQTDQLSVVVEPQAAFSLATEMNSAIILLTELQLETLYQVRVEYTNEFGHNKQTKTISFTTRSLNTVEATTPSANAVDFPPQQSLTFDFLFPLQSNALVSTIEPPLETQSKSVNDRLLIEPVRYFAPDTTYTVRIDAVPGTSPSAAITPYTLVFTTAAENTATEAADQQAEADAAYEEQYQQEQDAAQQQAEGDAQFYDSVTQLMAESPRVRVLNNLPYESAEFTITYLMKADTFTVSYDSEESKLAALAWFEGFGYIPENITWIPEVN